MAKIYGFFILSFLCFISSAQIVNVESVRKDADTSRWAGFVSLDISLVKNRRDIFKIANRSHIQHRNKNHLWLLINDINIQQLDQQKFVNRGIQHVRYNYKSNPRIAYELFVQAQYDPISNITMRGLLGTGPRFKVGTSKKHRFYLGTLVMYEYEETRELSTLRINRDIRGSMYLSLNFYPSDQVSLISASYYQPKMSGLKDFRISNETTLAFKIFKTLKFKSTFSFFYDEFPVASIPKTQYEWTNGVAYTF